MLRVFRWCASLQSTNRTGPSRPCTPLPQLLPPPPSPPPPPTTTITIPPWDRNQAHSSIQKAANIAGLGSNLRLIPTREWSDKNKEGTGRQDSRAGGDEHDQQCYTVDAADLSEAMRNDLKAGLTPVFVSANVGSTNTCAVDPVRAMGEACRRCVRVCLRQKVRVGWLLSSFCVVRFAVLLGTAVVAAAGVADLLLSLTVSCM